MLSFASDKQYVKYGNITRGFYAARRKTMEISIMKQKLFTIVKDYCYFI